MYVIRRLSDNWYYTGSRNLNDMWSPDSSQALTYLAPNPARLCTLNEVYEEREPWQISLPVILLLTMVGWLALAGISWWMYHYLGG